MPDINEFDMLYSDNASNEDRPVPTYTGGPHQGQTGGNYQYPHGGGHNQYPYGGGYNQYPYGGGYNQYPYGGGYSQPQVPTAPPPAYVPRKPYGHHNPSDLRNCVYRLGYIWLNDGRSFWTWLTFVGPRTIEGYRWNGNTWRYFEADYNDIQTFVCM